MAGVDGVKKKRGGVKFRLKKIKTPSRSNVRQTDEKSEVCLLIQNGNRDRSTTTTATDNDENFLDDNTFSLPRDTLLIIRSAIQNCSAGQCSPASGIGLGFHFVLKSMFHATLMGSSTVPATGMLHGRKSDDEDAWMRHSRFTMMEELEEAKNENSVRWLYLNAEDVAIMETGTYVMGVRDAAAYFKGSNATEENASDFILERFITSLSNCTKMTVGRKLLEDLIAGAGDLPSTEMHLSVQYLLNIGVLLPKIGSLHVHAEPNYYFSLPTLGKSANQIVKGRKALVLKLKRSYTKEMSLDVLDRCHFSDLLPTPFHLRDTLSKGLVVTKKSLSGKVFLRLVDTDKRKKH